MPKSCCKNKRPCKRKRESVDPLFSLCEDGLLTFVIV